MKINLYVKLADEPLFEEVGIAANRRGMSVSSLIAEALRAHLSEPGLHERLEQRVAALEARQLPPVTARFSGWPHRSMKDNTSPHAMQVIVMHARREAEIQGVELVDPENPQEHREGDVIVLTWPVRLERS